MFSILLSLFIASFLAATVLPLSSEAALSAALLTDLPPVLLIAVATLGNSIGSFATYLIGRLGKLVWAEKYLKISTEKIVRARLYISKYGGIAAFFCFLPIVGDLISVVLGFMRMKLPVFLIFMSAGKLARYIIWFYAHTLAVNALR